MKDNCFGRNKFIDVIKMYAESTEMENKAFLGLKGVGKTKLFNTYFKPEKISEIAEKYKKLFVIFTLDSHYHGVRLYEYLIDHVKTGIRRIPDRNEKIRIEEEREEIDKYIDTPESKLFQYLELLKHSGYEFVLVMDHFHVMARDNEVGREQYEVLRSLHERGLIFYWIITDTDLMDNCVTEGYQSSLFEQKFNSRITIDPLSCDSRLEVVEHFLKIKKSEITKDEKYLIADVSGGVPELISYLIDVLDKTKRNDGVITKDEIECKFLNYYPGVSIFKSWISGLNNEQKRIIYNIAVMDNGLHESDEDIDYDILSNLSDGGGRGLLHLITNDEWIWVISIDLFKKYVLNCGPAFYGETEQIDSCAVEVLAPVSPILNPEPQIINNIYVEGNYIQSQTNNVINISDAVGGLVELKKLVSKNRILLDKSQVEKKLELLPFAQDIWNELGESEQEEELDKFSEGIFSSDIFSEGNLNDDQKKRFCISDNLLANLTDTCKTQIICGIQVYDLIQLCIDRFGLNVNESESPRGILFARAFESHLQDYAAPAFRRIPEIANKIIPPRLKKFIEYPLDKTTIGTYSSILEQEYSIFSQASVQLLNDAEKNDRWWKRLKDNLNKICELRNSCCHSGTRFKNRDLLKLKQLIFNENSLEDVLAFRRIPALQPNMFSPLGIQIRNAISSNLPAKKISKPDPALIGQRVKFKILEKTSNKKFRGEVNEKFWASLPKVYAQKLNYPELKNTEIDAVVDKILDDKYVLRLP